MPSEERRSYLVRVYVPPLGVIVLEINEVTIDAITFIIYQFRIHGGAINPITTNQVGIIHALLDRGHKVIKPVNAF